MSTPNAEIVDGLLKWWTARYGIVPGSRNANLYKLAAAFNNYGIAQAEALEVCLRYSDPTSADPLTAREITATVASAYRRTEHGVKHWTPGKKERPTPTPTPPRVLTDAQARANVDAVATSLMSAVISLVRIQRTAHRTLSCACSHGGQGVMPIIRSTRNGAAGIIAERLNQLLADYLTDHPHTVT